MKETFLEVHVPISPRGFLLNRVRYLAKSLRSLGGDYADSRIIATVGDLSPPVDLDRMMPWAREEGVEWRWVDPDSFQQWQLTANRYVYTMMDRFRSDFTSEYVIIADADIIFLRQFDDLISMVGGDLDVGGSMTHVPPFSPQTHAEMWTRMFAAFDLPPPVLEFEHTGWQDMFFDAEMRYSPAYFNSGMMIGTREAMNRMVPLAIPALNAVKSVQNTFFFDQLAFTLMMYKARVSKKLIPLRFNFPNQESFETRFPEEANEAAVVHYLRTEQFHRDQIFESKDSIEAFINRTDLAGSNERVRSRVETIHRMLFE